jgi:hypothetical protein
MKKKAPASNAWHILYPLLHALSQRPIGRQDSV